MLYSYSCTLFSRKTLCAERRPCTRPREWRYPRALDSSRATDTLRSTLRFLQQHEEGGRGSANVKFEVVTLTQATTLIE